MHLRKLCTSLLVLMVFGYIQSNAQDAKKAAAYMKKINSHHKDVTKRMWRYTKSITNEHNQNRIQRRREKVLEELRKAKANVANMKGYKGNTKLREEVVDYLALNYKVISQDYDEIMNLRKIKRKSYSQMEAYYEAQSKANEKLEKSHKKLQKAQEAFAAKHNINLTKNLSKRQKRMKQANKMFDYHKDIYLIFYKPYREETYFLKAYKNNNVSKMQQHKSALLDYAKAGLDSLKDYEPFEGDYSMIKATRDILRFYKREAKHKFDDYIEVVLQKEKFQKIKKAFENKSKSEKQEMADRYNKAVKAYNEKVNQAKETREELSDKRSDKFENWQDTSSDFKDDHVNTGFFDFDF